MEEYIEKYFLDRYRNPQDEEIVTIARKDLDAYVIKARDNKVIFTGEELEYIYDYLDCLENEKIYKQIENKVRKQVKRYRDFDKKRNA